uniref:YchJ family metal-binding protein n=1 Tax=Thaumasiovibrio occultus TaxID=1891184 RepID=UPI000B361EED|nr:YchJ family metal-binding protein [Thaumasiovibrio occultus]
MSTCYCGNATPFAQCCAPIHADATLALKPEQLMRSRYSAHCCGNVDYVVATYHPSCNAESFRQAIAESIDSHWIRLDVLEAPEVTEQDDNGAPQGWVHFQAWYREGDKLHCLEERSRFLFENGQWFYVDGQYPERPTAAITIGRNDDCPCGSGKKFKKCCIS